MDLMKIAAQLFMNKVGGSNLEQSSVISALSQLLPTEGGNLDIGSLVSMFTQNGGGLANLAQSWLGDGGNENFGVDDVLGLFGESKVSDFASQLGLGKQDAASGLSDMIPDLIDQSSEGGNLVSDIGSKLAKSALSKFF